jgi:hypothetical protein
MDFALPQTRLGVKGSVLTIDTTRGKELQARHDRTGQFFSATVAFKSWAPVSAFFYCECILGENASERFFVFVL